MASSEVNDLKDWSRLMDSNLASRPGKDNPGTREGQLGSTGLTRGRDESRALPTLALSGSHWLPLGQHSRAPLNTEIASSNAM